MLQGLAIASLVFLPAALHGAPADARGDLELARVTRSQARPTRAVLAELRIDATGAITLGRRGRDDLAPASPGELCRALCARADAARGGGMVPSAPLAVRMDRRAPLAPMREMLAACKHAGIAHLELVAVDAADGTERAVRIDLNPRDLGRVGLGWTPRRDKLVVNMRLGGAGRASLSVERSDYAGLRRAARAVAALAERDPREPLHVAAHGAVRLSDDPFDLERQPAPPKPPRDVAVQDLFDALDLAPLAGERALELEVHPRQELTCVHTRRPREPLAEPGADEAPDVPLAFGPRAIPPTPRPLAVFEVLADGRVFSEGEPLTSGFPLDAPSVRALCGRVWRAHRTGTKDNSAVLRLAVDRCAPVGVVEQIVRSSAGLGSRYSRLELVVERPGSTPPWVHTVQLRSDRPAVRVHAAVDPTGAAQYAALGTTFRDAGALGEILLPVLEKLPRSRVALEVAEELPFQAITDVLDLIQDGHRHLTIEAPYRYALDCR